MLGGIFICYRREEAAYAARAICDRLTKRLGRENVFFDVDNIQPGQDFVDILTEWVARCDALVVVIGRGWASSADKDNQRRLDDPDDFVRIEIEAALQRGIRIIPVLIDGAAMPRPSDLPDSLKKLTRRSGIEISHTRFDSDVRKLTQALSLLEDELRQRAERERATQKEEVQRKIAITATVTGNDQQVGFRAMIMKIAIEYNLAGTAENEQDEVVRFAVQGDAKRVYGAVAAINEGTKKSSNVEVSTSSATVDPKLNTFAVIGWTSTSRNITTPYNLVFTLRGNDKSISANDAKAVWRQILQATLKRDDLKKLSDD